MKHSNHSSQRSSAERALPRSGATAKAAGTTLLAFGLAALAAGVFTHSAAQAQPLPWMNSGLAPEERAALLVGAMTLAQKEEQLVGTVPGMLPELPQCKGGRHVTGIPSLSIPTLRITNGPVGIGQNDCVSASIPPVIVVIGGDLVDVSVYTDPSSAKATALPSAIALAASFDPGCNWADRWVRPTISPVRRWWPC